MRAKQVRGLPDRRRICVVGLTATLTAGSMLLCPHRLIAQAPAQSDNPVRVGDRWTFATKDEITGLPTETFAHEVTQIAANQIVVSASTQGKGASRPVIFDRDWNRIEDRNFKFKPQNGLGVRPALAVGVEWQTENETRNVETGAAWKDKITSKVVAQETITTPAGTFEAFKIETRRHEISAADPARFWDYEYVRWYSPQINHWVRWSSIGKAENRLRTNRSEELIEFGRKE
jgi:hypothetical protein